VIDALDDLYTYYINSCINTRQHSMKDILIILQT